MPALIAAPWLGTAIAGVAGGTAAIVGAKMQTGATSRAARMQTDSANHAADVQAASARETLDFTRQEAQQKAEQAEADRRANYDQWAAQMNAHNAARARYGYGTTAIPGYVPGKVPSYTNSPGAALMGQGGPMPPAPAPRVPAPSPSPFASNPNSVGSMLIPPSGPPPGFDPLADPRLPARPASRSIGASLYGGR